MAVDNRDGEEAGSGGLECTRSSAVSERPVNEQSENANAVDTPSSGTLPELPAFERVIAVCDRYEAEWRAGRAPRIEDWLGKVGESERQTLLRELLALDLELRRGGGEQPEARMYRERFPDAVQVIDRLFEEPGPVTTKQQPEGPSSLPTAPLFSAPVSPPAATPVSRSVGAEPVPGYRLVRILGRGGFGEVWEAEAPGGIRVALKFIGLGGEESAPEVRALQIIRNIRHPHLLDVQFAVFVGDDLILAMPLCDRSLWDVWKEHRAQGRPGIPRPELLGYMIDLARAVDFLNERRHPSPDDGSLVGVQHRDIKPQNIFLVGGSVRLADFGLAKILETSAAYHSGGMSPHYVAPEALAGTVSANSDQYSLAMTYYRLQVGEHPFPGPVSQVIFGHVHHAPDLSGLPTGPREAVARALSKRSEDRWPTCREFVRGPGARLGRSRGP